MHRAGQFLVEPNEFLGWFNPIGIVAVGVMLFTLFKLRANYLLRLSPSVSPEKFGVGLGVGGALSIVSTLLLTTTSLMFFETVVELTNADVNQDRARAAGIDQNRHAPTRVNPALVHGAARSLGAASKNKALLVAIAVGILLLVVGAGYAFTLLKLGFWGSFAAMSAGVALPEELTKAAAGLLVLYMLFDTKSLSEVQFRRTVLAAFGIAGLGFGAGEALKYFGAYAHEDAGVFWYGVRAVWCVTLHGAWTLIVGAMLATSLPQDPKGLGNKEADTFFMLLLASVPTAIAHGLYNTCCEHVEVLPWIVGGLSIFVAMAAIECFLQENPQEPQPEQQPS
jgi:hypothetical protein